MSQDIKLGETIARPSTAARDAVHVAVMPVTAAERLDPGDRVVVYGGRARIARHPEPPTGVVDPFLREMVLTGDVFWLFLMPGSVKNLRHDWDHPAFPSQVDTSIAEAVREQWDDDGCRGCS